MPRQLIVSILSTSFFFTKQILVTLYSNKRVSAGESKFHFFLLVKGCILKQNIFKYLMILIFRISEPGRLKNDSKLSFYRHASEIGDSFPFPRKSESHKLFGSPVHIKVMFTLYCTLLCAIYILIRKYSVAKKS